MGLVFDRNFLFQREKKKQTFLAGIVGEMDESGKAAYIWTHKKLEIGYNDERIVDVNLTSEAKVRLQPNMQIPFSYEVIWKPINVPFVKRFDKYLDPGFFQHKVKIIS